ncbi:MAG: thioredoxin family protein, partial [Chthonomonadales bacterium]|nr:thioredoxin family protein [Chthonomonadales bacterium]
YGNYKHESSQPPKVVLLIDRNGNGNFDVPMDATGTLMFSSTKPIHLAEAYDVTEPFRIGGLSYEVATLDNKGTTISLRRSSVNVRDSMTAADLRVGGDAISFNVERMDGKKVSFPEDYKGKIVLVDFWATFSPDYRAEAPGIVQTYSQYHADGFEILGVSVDKSGAKQMIAEYLEQMGMAWPQIYDGAYYKAEVASLYGVQSIPNSMLVDGDTGRILAMGNSLRGAGLADAVANALANKKR